MSASTHEDFRRTEEVHASSDRAFGFVFTGVFLIAGAWPLLRGKPVRLWALGVAAAFLLVSLALPRALGPLNRLWLRFGLLIQRIVSPIVLGVVFFSTVTPIGLLMRLTGKNPLRLGFDREATSYWIDRQPPGPAPDTMPRQF